MIIPFVLSLQRLNILQHIDHDLVGMPLIGGVHKILLAIDGIDIDIPERLLKLFGGGFAFGPETFC